MTSDYAADCVWMGGHYQVAFAKVKGFPKLSINQKKTAFVMHALLDHPRLVMSSFVER